MCRRTDAGIDAEVMESEPEGGTLGEAEFAAVVQSEAIFSAFVWTFLQPVSAAG
ncbi:hypothetical protein [Paenibacillus chitinolyticus]